MTTRVTLEPLRVRRLGVVDYDEALALQTELFERVGESWLLLLEHPHVYTLGVRARPEHVLVDPAQVGATLVRTNRGGDVTYHGPGQLVGYPILDVPFRPGAVSTYVASVEQVVINALTDVGLDGAGREPGYAGVWVSSRKIAAIGVRLTRGRSMHGFAINVDPDLMMFEHIVPCGLHGLAVTSLAAEGVAASIDEVADAIEQRASEQWAIGMRVPA
ncbi:MAG: lipoyl(octanoyl) transferase LipB [Acidimicrobiia bacterium]|jgi:lipoic acid synthetase|nr:lipoyl(octanoyl) transferase LipB [Acidimicrobiia bacterium]